MLPGLGGCQLGGAAHEAAAPHPLTHGLASGLHDIPRGVQDAACHFCTRGDGQGRRHNSRANCAGVDTGESSGCLTEFLPCLWASQFGRRFSWKFSCLSGTPANHPGDIARLGQTFTGGLPGQLHALDARAHAHKHGGVQYLPARLGYSREGGFSGKLLGVLLVNQFLFPAPHVGSEKAHIGSS